MSITKARKPGDWTLAAACVDEDVNTFFPDNRRAIADGRVAKAICAGCEVRTECLADALAPPIERFGVRGGLSAYERDELLKKARKAGRS